MAWSKAVIGLGNDYVPPSSGAAFIPEPDEPVIEVTSCASSWTQQTHTLFLGAEISHICSELACRYASRSIHFIRQRPSMDRKRKRRTAKSRTSDANTNPSAGELRDLNLRAWTGAIGRPPRSLLRSTTDPRRPLRCCILPRFLLEEKHCIH